MISRKVGSASRNRLGSDFAFGAGMLRKWVLISLLPLSLSSVAVAEAPGCPLAVIDWSASASDDLTFDADTSRQLARALVVAAERDLGHATEDRNTVGAELSKLSAHGQFVAYDVLSLALRLRQLDCAVWARTATDIPARYRAIISDGNVVAIRLGAGPLSTSPATYDWKLPPSLMQVTVPRLIDPLQRSRKLKIAGGTLLGVGASFLAGTVVLAVVRAGSEPATCPPNAFFCLADLSNGFRDFELGAAIVFGVLGVGMAVVGGVVLHKAARWAEKVVPSITVSSSGGKVGLVIPF